MRHCHFPKRGGGWRDRRRLNESVLLLADLLMATFGRRGASRTYSQSRIHPRQISLCSADPCAWLRSPDLSQALAGGWAGERGWPAYLRGLRATLRRTHPPSSVSSQPPWSSPRPNFSHSAPRRSTWLSSCHRRQSYDHMSRSCTFLGRSLG